MTTLSGLRRRRNRWVIGVMLLCGLPAVCSAAVSGDPPAPSAEAPPVMSPPFPAEAPPGMSPPFPGEAPLPAQPAPAAPQPPPPVPAPAARGYFFKFNNAEIYDVIHSMARAAGINYLIDPRVKGVVNVQTQGVVRDGGVMELLLAILKVNGATAIREGDTYHIVPMGEAKTSALLPVIGEDNTGKRIVSQVVLRVFPLKHIVVSEMAKVIRPLLSPGAEAIEVAQANTLLVIDTEGNNEKTAELVKLFDSDDFRTAGMKLFRLKVLDPEEMAKNLTAFYGALDASGGGGKPSWINFVPVPRLGAIMVVCASPGTLTEVGKWIDELDRDSSGAARTYRRYRVKFGKVKDVSAVVQQMFPKRTTLLSAGPDKPTEFRPAIGQAAGSTPPPPLAPAPVAAAAGKDSGKAVEGGFEIVSDEPTNSLVIRASGSEYAELLELLKVVDVYPQQVLLEVLVGEVNLDDTLRLGVDWKYLGTADGYNQTVAVNPLQSIGTGTLSYLVEKTGRLTAAFRALATAGKASVLSSPSIVATNGKKSKINVADSIPIVTSTLQSNTNPPVTTTTVEYKDVGVLLSFTPFINESGMVTLEIDQEVSEVSNTSASASNNPTFFKRTISTNLVASQDQSIVLGGLVKEKKSLNRDGIPFFYKIPVFGWLFGSRDNEFTRTELLIFITPRVVRSPEEGQRMSREFEDRVEELKARLGETSGIRSNSGARPADPGK